MAKDTLHVVPQGEAWAVKREGNERSSSTHPTQREAIDSARDLAKDGDDLVIHRPDGTIRERTTYSGPPDHDNKSHAPAEPRTRLEPSDVLSVGTRVSWSAVMAGVAVTITVYVCLMLLAAAIGLSSEDYLQGRTFAIVSALVGIITLLAALFLGGYVATRMTTRETKGEAVVYGVLLWAGVFFVLLLTGLNLGSRVGVIPQISRPPVAEVRVNDPAGPKVTITDQERTRREEMLARGEQVLSEMKPATLAWWTFAATVCSILAAIAGALCGAGPELTFRHFWRRRAPAPGEGVVLEKVA